MMSYGLRETLIIILVLFSVSSSQSILADPVEDWIDRYRSYTADYRDLFAGKCRPTRKTARIFMDQVDCLWRNDQILLKRYDLEFMFYDASYSRYSSLFNKAKIATVNSDYEYFVEEEARLTADTEELQKVILIEFLREALDSK